MRRDGGQRREEECEGEDEGEEGKVSEESDGRHSEVRWVDGLAIGWGVVWVRGRSGLDVIWLLQRRWGGSRQSIC